jgi:hypothetical protein
MRPVERGPWPMDSDGNDISFAEYGHAKKRLVERLEKYCSFCERPTLGGLAVEHIQSKHHNTKLSRDWTNFLLACVNCNSTKLTKIRTEDDEARYLLPHRDRTFDAFDYTAGAVRLVKVSDPKLRERAQATDALVGLTRTPHAGLTTAQLLGATDTRYEDRRRAYQLATNARKDLIEQDTPVVRRLTLDLAKAVGFWSVWMTVFRNDEQMQAALCDAKNFPGTARDRVDPLPPHARPLPKPTV